MSTADPTATDALRAHSDRIAGIVDTLGAGAVAVLGRRGAIASGAVWRDGLVVTAAHVVRRTPAALTLVDPAGVSRAATLVGIDSSTDLALFRLADADAVTPLPLVEAAPVRAGRGRRPCRRRACRRSRRSGRNGRAARRSGWDWQCSSNKSRQEVTARYAAALPSESAERRSPAAQLGRRGRLCKSFRTSRLRPTRAQE